MSLTNFPAPTFRPCCLVMSTWTLIKIETGHEKLCWQALNCVVGKKSTYLQNNEKEFLTLFNSRTMDIKLIWTKAQSFKIAQKVSFFAKNVSQTGPKCPFFFYVMSTFETKRSSLRSQCCQTRFFEWFSNIVNNLMIGAL